MQNAVIPMCIAVTVNIVHVSTSLWLVFGHGMGGDLNGAEISMPFIRCVVAASRNREGRLQCWNREPDIVSEEWYQP